MKEDQIKKHFENWLHNQGYQNVRVKLGKERGPDIEAVSPNGRKFFAEVKSHRTKSSTRKQNEFYVDYNTLLGQILRLMNKHQSRAEYAVVIEDGAIETFRRYFLPYAIKRMKMRAYAVSTNGAVRPLID